MSAPRPKVLRILETIRDRLQVISQAAGYWSDIGSDVRLSRQQPNDVEAPCVLVYRNNRAVEEMSHAAARCSFTITVEAYAERGPDDTLTGEQLLADIQQAVELEDETLDGLLTQQYGLAFESDEVFFPETGANVVGAAVTYSAPHIRKHGNPDKG